MSKFALQLTLFLIGLALVGGGGIDLLLFTAFRPLSSLPKSMLRASSWKFFYHYFLLPCVAMVAGMVLIAVAFLIV